jgi:hypothetical protein
LNSIVQVIITVLLNTLIAAEYICLALLSGSVLFELFIHLGLFLLLSYVCIAHIYKPHLLSIRYFFFKRVAYIYMYTGATIVVGRCRQQVSLELTLLLLFIVMMLVVYVIYAAPSLSYSDEELRNILFLSFFLLHSTFF